MLNKIRISLNFMLSEFDSPDTHQVIIHPMLLDFLQRLRDRLARPVLVRSGYRTPSYNRQVKGKSGSYHPQGMAADIECPGVSSIEIAKEAEAVGFTGIIVYHNKGIVHLDIRKKPYKRGVV